MKHMEYVRIWEKENRKRAYISDEGIKKALNLEVEHYKTGNISSAKMDGEKISNSEAFRILLRFSDTYYDMINDKWSFDESSEYADRIINFFEKDQEEENMKVRDYKLAYILGTTIGNEDEWDSVSGWGCYETYKEALEKAEKLVINPESAIGGEGLFIMPYLVDFSIGCEDILKVEEDTGIAINPSDLKIWECRIATRSCRYDITNPCTLPALEWNDIISEIEYLIKDNPEYIREHIDDNGLFDDTRTINDNVINFQMKNAEIDEDGNLSLDPHYDTISLTKIDS